MSESKSQAQEVVFDFGTSPHGLSADLPRTHQETRPAERPHSLEDQQAPQGRADDLAASTTPRSGAAGEPQVFELTEEQRCHLAYAALCHITMLEECDESEEPEVLHAIRVLIQVRDMLKYEGSPA